MTDRNNAEAGDSSGAASLQVRTIPLRKTRAANGKTSFVYLLHSVSLNAYKIGRAQNPYRRLKTFKTALPDITLRHLIPVLVDSDCEKMLQNYYSDNHWQGEWYRLSDEEVLEICALNGISDIYELVN